MNKLEKWCSFALYLNTTVVRHPIGHTLQVQANRTKTLTASASAKAKEVQANTQNRRNCTTFAFAPDLINRLMRHSNLVDKYNKAQKHFEKGNYRRAKWLFESIVSEISTSDTDAMGDIHLHNSAEQYLEEINEKDLSIHKRYWIIVILAIITLILYFTFR